MRKYKIFSAIAIVMVLTFVFFKSQAPEQPEVLKDTASAFQTPEPTIAPTVEPIVTPTQTPPPKTVLPTKPPASEETAAPTAVPESDTLPTEDLTCTLSVKCDIILENLSSLTQGKEEIIPQDGIIYPEQTVVFYEGESVFNVLLREMKKNKIHFEFVNTPIYNSAYIEGINNIYEFDCGELSGWIYSVNDVFPNYGCSQYMLKDGDKIEWIYTCDLGIDVRSFYSFTGE